MWSNWLFCHTRAIPSQTSFIHSYDNSILEDSNFREEVRMGTLPSVQFDESNAASTGVLRELQTPDKVHALPKRPAFACSFKVASLPAVPEGLSMVARTFL
jgi:hypothetical protein